VSIKAMPTPLPVSPVAARLVAPIVAATSVTLFPLLDAHWVAAHGDDSGRAGADAVTELGVVNRLPTTAETATTDVATPYLRCANSIIASMTIPR
jgi:hypothetical protein